LILEKNSYVCNSERRTDLIKGIIFDAYGTLINTGGGSIQAAQRILEKNKKTLTPKYFTKMEILS